MKLRTIFLWLLIASFSLVAVVGIAAIIAPDVIVDDEKVLISALLLGLYSLPALACSIVLGKKRFVYPMRAGIAAAPAAWVVWLPLIWGNPWQWSEAFDWDEFILKAGMTLTIITLWAAHFGLLSLLRIDRAWFQRVRLGALGLTALIAVVILIAMWPEWEAEWFIRTLGAASILASCGTVVSPIFALLDVHRRTESRETMATRVEMQIVCPRCGQSQVVQTGVAHCAACRLRITIEVEEPRCACGYHLYRLQSETCPECGREVPAEARWGR